LGSITPSSVHKPATNQQLYLLEFTAETLNRKLAQISIKPRKIIEKSELEILEKMKF
jgi:hypothetical protein